MYFVLVNLVLGAMVCVLLMALSGYLYHRHLSRRHELGAAKQARDAFMRSLSGYQSELLMKSIESSKSSFVIARDDLLPGTSQLLCIPAASEGDGYA